MPMSNEMVTKGLEPLLLQIEHHESEIVRLKMLANQYALALGADAPFQDIAGTASAGSTRRDAIKPDQFTSHGAPSAATRAYLEWRGKERGAATIDEIYDALFRGGFSFDNRNAEDAKSGLKVALGKDALIHRLNNGHYGLLNWYGQGVKRPKGNAKDGGGNKKSDATAGMKPLFPQTSTGDAPGAADEDTDAPFPEGEGD